MALNSEQVGRLLKMIQHTREVELTCAECIAEMDEYAQRTLDDEPLDGMLELVRQHLDACSFCDAEFKLILETLKAIEKSQLRVESNGCVGEVGRSIYRGAERRTGGDTPLSI